MLCLGGANGLPHSRQCRRLTEEGGNNAAHRPASRGRTAAHTAALTYALLLDRAHLSQLNGWTDEAGRVYLIFPVEKSARFFFAQARLLRLARSAAQAEQ